MFRGFWGGGGGGAAQRAGRLWGDRSLREEGQGVGEGGWIKGAGKEAFEGRRYR